MKRVFCVLVMILLAVSGIVPVSAEEESKVLDLSSRLTCIDGDWLFAYGEQAGGEDIQLDDSGWEELSLPHDWSISMDYSEDCEAESGFLPGGTGWYRKKFILPESLSGKRISVIFDGAYQRAEVYLNGHKLGEHPDGYTSFSFDLTAYLAVDGKTENVLAVRVENQQPNSRWYTGSGIYRDVWLKVTDPVRIDEEGTVISYDPDALKETGNTEVSASIVLQNETDTEQSASVMSVMADPEGAVYGEAVSSQVTIPARGQAELVQTIAISDPDLWSVSDPEQYTWKITINSSYEDEVSIPFGFRYAEWDPDHGFSLNGEAMKLKGVCLHQDYGALGTACYEAAVERQLNKLKEMGVNAIRSAHNPAGRILRELCAEKGFLLLEEGFDTYLYPKNGNTYDGSSWFTETVGSDNEIEGAYAEETWAEYVARKMVRESRNNPAVIMYSIGNELLGNIGGDPSEYPKYASEIISWIRDEDPSAVVTIGDNMAGKDNATQNAIDQEIIDAKGAVGLNYATAEVYDDMHEAYPDWCFYGSETASALNTRGWYSSKGIDEKNLQVSAYDHAHVEWGSTAEEVWKNVIERDYLAGEFIWTGWDYLGEPEPWNGLGAGSVTGQGPRPKSSYFGVIDTAGFEKDSYYFYQSQWNDSVTTLHILPDWNREDLKKDWLGRVTVAVYSNAASVELFCNGKSLGRKDFTKQTTDDGYTYQTYKGSLYLTWKIWYRSGELSAKAYDEDGNVITDTVGRSRVVTSGKPAKIVLTSQESVLTADGKDLAFVTAEIQDADGNPVYGAARQLSFTLNGNGIIAGADNGDPTDLSSYQGTDETHAARSTFSGKALIIIQSGTKSGTLTLSAEGEGLESDTIELKAVSAKQEPF